LTPPELLLGSLGSCAAYCTIEYLRTRDLARSNVRVTVTAEKLLKPPRLGSIRVQVHCPVPLTPEHTVGLLNSVRQGFVHNTLLSPPEIKVELGPIL
jgi:uncharacterized OsmC-like protein